MADSKVYLTNRFRSLPTKAPCFGAPEKSPNPSPLPAKQRGRPRKYCNHDWPRGVWDITNPDWIAVWRAWRAFIIVEKRRANIAKARQAKLCKVRQHLPNRLANGNASESLSARVRYLYHEYRLGEVGTTHKSAIKLIAARTHQSEKMIVKVINNFRTE